MEIPTYIEAVEREGRRLVAAASRVELDARVPSCPEWDVRELVRHAAGVHTWAATSVRDRHTDEIEGELEDIVGGWPPDDDLLDWADAALTTLVDVLRAADPEFPYFTWLDGPTPLTMWCRRMAHETSIHRVDAELAVGAVTPFEPDFAADGIDELLLAMIGDWDKEVAVDAPVVLGVEPTDIDQAWTVTIRPDGLRPRAGRGSDPDGTVTGTASDLYRVTYNRGGEFEVRGDRGALEAWWGAVAPRWV